MDPQSFVTVSAPLRALFGFAEPDGTDWGPIRALQMRPLRGHQLVRIGLDITLAAVAASLFLQESVTWLVGCWIVGLTLFDLYSYSYYHRADLWHRKSVMRREMQLLHFHALINGLFWAMAFGLAAWQGDASAALGVWAISLVIMVAAATLVSSVPLASIMFIVASSIGAMACFWWIDMHVYALVAFGVSVPLVASSARQAQYYVLQHLAEQDLKEKSETVSLLLREFEDTGADWLWQTDTSRCATHVSPRFAHAIGQDTEELNGQPILKLFAGDNWDSGEYPEALHQLAERLKRREAFSNLIVPVMINGRQRWWELSASPRMGDQDRFLGFRGVGSDVTEQRESEDKISQLARFDTLTGLPNRLHLIESLNSAMQEADRWGSRCAFMMIDLDRFKAVNDTLGHPVGDRLLAHVSRRLQSIMTKNEMCGRLGGDEFAIVVNDATDTDRTDQLAEQVIESLSRPYEVDQHTIYIGASIGSAIGPRDGRTVDMLMRSADLALYRSKDEGGGQHHIYRPQFHASAEERRQLEIELRKAIQRDEFSLVYQPVVEASEGGLTGFEALLRWDSAKFGTVSPAKFIPLAEDAGLIVSIGEWVMRRACEDAAKWPSEVKVAVNVSAEQLTSQSFVGCVLSALHDARLPAQRLEIEVTENLFMRDGSLALQLLERIKALGIGLSLDDFGTGYSSLGYLRKTRFDTIKVDRSFVQGAARNVAESLAIIRSVVAMADSLGMATTAEGVETEEELAIVRKLGCSKIQGYYFGKPMPFEETMGLFGNRTRGAA